MNVILKTTLVLLMHACSVTRLCLTLCNPMDRSPPGSSVHGISHFPGKNTGVGCHFLLQGIFPTQGSNHVSCISCMAGGFFAAWAIGKAWLYSCSNFTLYRPVATNVLVFLKGDFYVCFSLIRLMKVAITCGS